MSSINHITGGIVITGIFTSFWEINILSKSWYLITCIFFSLLPDIDHPKSFIGKLFPPISKYLDRNYGHRTISHGLLFFISSIIIILFIEKILLNTTKYTLIAFFAYLSHLLFDMMTIQGIPLLYPFKRNPCVIPGNPDLRFKSGHFNSEALIFFFLIILGFTCKDLFKEGFWTSYNKAFSSPRHLAKEFRKSTKLISVNYHFLFNGITKEGKGYLIGVEKQQLFIYDNKYNITSIPFSAVIYDLKYQKTPKEFKIEKFHFSSIDLKTLKDIIKDKPIIKLRLNSESDFIHNTKEAISSKQITFNYITNPEIKLQNPQKERIIKELSKLNQNLIKQQNKEQLLINNISRLRQNLNKNNLYEREKNTIELKKLIKELEKLRSLNLCDGLKNKTRILKESLNKESKLDGYVIYVLV